MGGRRRVGTKSGAWAPHLVDSVVGVSAGGAQRGCAHWGAGTGITGLDGIGIGFVGSPTTGGAMTVICDASETNTGTQWVVGTQWGAASTQWGRGCA